ncbi:MAG: TrkA family potassium uptake protein [bacterium]|nr:TrkA family potassium uptake protein [bacterium]
MSIECAVIGLGRFGMEVALGLARRHVPVLAVDQNRELVEDISEYVDNALCFDTTNESALRDARIHEMPLAVVAIGDNHVEDSILTTALLRQIGVPRIIARASTDLHAKILRIVGANEVVNPEKEMGGRIAQRVIAPGLTELIPLSEGFAIAELRVPPSFIGRSMSDLRVRSRYGVNVVALRRRARDLAPDEPASTTFLLNPSPEEPFEPNDILIVAGKEQDVKNLAALK